MDISFLEKILRIPSPSGMEQRIQDALKEELKGIECRLRMDRHGNLTASSGPEGPGIVMDAHCDEIGFMVRYVDEDGFAYIAPIGDWEPSDFLGAAALVLDHMGEVKEYGILCGDTEKPKEKRRDEDSEDDSPLVWLDCGYENRGKAGISVGDYGVLEIEPKRIGNRMLCARALDDKAGLFCALEAFKKLASSGVSVPLHLVSSVQEEVGYRGSMTASYVLKPLIGIAVDVTEATDRPEMKKEKEGDIRLGAGPVIYSGPNIRPYLRSILIDAARENDIPCQSAAAPDITETNASAMQTSGVGAGTVCIEIPLRYLHSPRELIAIKDLQSCIDLNVQFIKKLMKHWNDYNFRLLCG